MRRMALVVTMLVTAACSKPVDMTQAIQVDVATSGWRVAGVVDGKNKIVPSAVFRLASTNAEIGADFRPVSLSGGLPASASTQKITLKAALGYTGTDPVDELLNNSHFSDAKVEVFVKAGSGQWTRIGEYPIARQLTGD
jgi:hypothetical protein